MGVRKALHRAEQKQRRTEPPQHTEPGGHPARKFKEIMDVIQHHQHQRDGLEPSPIQPFFHQLFHTDTPLLVLHPV